MKFHTVGDLLFLFGSYVEEAYVWIGHGAAAGEMYTVLQ